MKVNITLGNEARSGYININPLADPNDPNFIRTNINDLGVYLDDGEAEEIIALDAIDYAPIQEKEHVLQHWLSKLALNGTIIIGGTEIGNVAKAFALNQLDLNKFTELAYGAQLQKAGLITAEQMTKVLTGLGLRVIEKKIFNFSYYIKAVRNQ